MSWRVEWPKHEDLASWGRNRRTLQTGLQIQVYDFSGGVSNYKDRLVIHPINTRGQMSESCRVEVPLTHLGELIQALLEIQAVLAHAEKAAKVLA